MISLRENHTQDLNLWLLLKCGKTLSLKESFKLSFWEPFFSKVHILLISGPEIFGYQSSIGLKHHEWNDQSGKHYSMFFNVFVLLQIFNEVNARKLKSNELNVFKNFFNNPLFLVILVLTVAIQMLCIEFGGQSLKTVPLTQQEHLICLGLGSLSIFAGFFFKLLIPASLFNFLSKPSKPEDEQVEEKWSYEVWIIF